MSSDFATRLLSWFDAHGRKDLPWQSDRDAYRIWVSEIMLQQTRVQTVIPYFERFMQRFPDIASLADAPLDDVLHHWSGLGYYARARNLHRAAIAMRDEHDGEFPRDFDAVVELPGIGRSTAGAILSLAFDQRHAILDGNVKRVLARHAAIDGWPGSTAVAKTLWQRAEELTPARRVAAYTQAIMDLGATVCTRTAPRCERCPVSPGCEARKQQAIEKYPGRKPKTDKPLRQTTMLLAVADDTLYLERRPASGIWGGLWSLPEVEDIDAWCTGRLGTPAVDVQNWQTLRHSFTHFDLDITPVVVRIDAASSRVADQVDSTWYRLDDTLPGGIAAPVMKLIDTLKGTADVPNH